MNTANAMGKVIGFQSANILAEDIMTFLNDKAFSPKTREGYTTSIKEFIHYFCKGKDIATVTEEDLVEYEDGKPVKFKFSNAQIKKYRNYLSDKGLANVTVNTKMSGINSLFTELAKDRPYFNIAVFKVKPLADTSESYGDFSKEEIEMMLEEVKKYPDGYQKYVAIKLLCITSFRVSSMLKLTWSNIKKHDDNTYVVKAEGAAIGKGNKKDAKSINKEMYEELLMLKGEHDDNKIFHMHRKTLWDTINKLVKDLELDPQNERNLCVHSLKNFGINRILETGGTIVAAQRQGNHKSAKTTLEKYARFTDDPTQNPSLTIMQDVDTSIIKEASIEQLLIAIDGCGDALKVQLVKKLKEIMG
jgi:integrase